MSILSRLLGGPGKDGSLPASEAAPPIDPPSKSDPPAEAREDADRLVVRGQGLEDVGNFAAAETCYRDAVAAAPSYPRAHINLGNALQKLGRLDEAAATQRTALRFDPDHFGAHFNLGAVLLELHETEDAKAHLERVLELNPGMADAAILLADAYEAEGNLPGARRQLERALAIDPGHAGAAANLGVMLLETGDVDAATKSLRDALRADPDSVPALMGIARIDVRRGRADLADAPYRHALRVDPSDPLLWSSFLFSLNLRDDLDAQAVAREHFAFGRIFEGPRPAKAPEKSGRPRIRVGYVSADLMKHPMAVFMLPVLKSHDRAAFETICYSNSHVDDELTSELREASDRWRWIAGLDDATVADLVRADGIDVLVDLSGHTAHNRLGVFARKPAPVQATWLGYLNTTGLRAMDYRICDRYTDPEGEAETLSTESRARLPNSQWCYSPYYEIPLPEHDAGPDRPLVFGSFNQFTKVNDACLDLWSAILRELPDSQLRVYCVPSGIDEDEFLARLERRGVQRARVTLHGRLGALDYFAAIADADIALDPIPCNGATTTLDTLWMGTPVIGIRGNRAYSRGSYSILSASGVTELIAQNAADYVAMNIRLAKDTGGRVALSRSLRPRLQASPVMDTKSFTRDLESLYRSMLDAR